MNAWNGVCGPSDDGAADVEGRWTIDVANSVMMFSCLVDLKLCNEPKRNAGLFSDHYVSKNARPDTACLNGRQVGTGIS